MIVRSALPLLWEMKRFALSVVPVLGVSGGKRFGCEGPNLQKPLLAVAKQMDRDMMEFSLLHQGPGLFVGAPISTLVYFSLVFQISWDIPQNKL